jgi:TPR repeat protein
VPRDLAQGTAWYRSAAEQGEKIAQYNFAVMLFRGDGVTRDIEAALEWYRKAAEQGMPEAQTALGDAHATGVGVPADLDAAAGWYEKAAAQGHAPAQAKLAGLRGRGWWRRQSRCRCGRRLTSPPPAPANPPGVEEGPVAPRNRPGDISLKRPAPS